MFCSEEDCVKKQAFSYLAKRSFFVEELRLKLISKGFSQDVIDKVINLCIKQGFLDDQELTRQLVRRTRLKGFGSKAIWYKLHCKVGINRSILQQVILETESSQVEDLKRLLQRNQPIHVLNLQQRQRLIAKYLRRGYCYEEIVRCLAE